MSFLYGKKDRLDVLPDQRRSKPIPTFVENFEKAANFATTNDQSVSEGRLLQQQWEPIVDEINARNDGIPFPNPADVFTTSALSGLLLPSLNESTYQLNAKEIINHIESNPDLYPDLFGITTEGLLENAKTEALALRRQYEETTEDSPGFMLGAARFSGEVYGTASDPVLLYSMAQRNVGGVAAGLFGIMLREAAIGAGTEAIIQTEVKDWYESLGVDYSWEDFAANVAVGGVFGAGAPLVFKIGGDTVKLTADQAKKGYEALVNSGAFTPKATTRAAENLANTNQDLASANPLTDDNAHAERFQEAVRAVENNRAPAIPDVPPVDVKAPNSVYDADNLDGLVYRFDPDTIQVDAETFQFKAGGDEFGVSDRLQGVTEWDPIKAGQVTVYQYADGGQFIADGHQRLGLARRIKQQDPSQDVRLYGHLMREVDGITPEMARVAAAMKNVAEGTGTAIDAAKVLRVAPERAGELPPRSALVRQAQELTFLDDDAFGAVINGLVPANYAAAIGRLIPDNPGLQKDAMSILAKTDPANEFQAEAIVRQVREAGFEQREQVGLFGDEMITESFFTERARILDRAQKSLRQDKNAFGSLVNNADRLAAEGNILAQNANLRRAENDAQALALLQALANKVGPLSDSLTAAARQARETGSYTEPTRGFVDAIRNAIESGDFERIGAGDVGRPGHDPTQSSVRANEAEPELEGFDEPSGDAAARQADQLTEDMLGGAEAADAFAEIENPKVVERAFKDAQPVESIDDLYNLAPAAQNYIVRVGEQLRRDLNIQFKNPNLKKRAAAEEKLTRKSYASVREMTDIARAGFIIDSPGQAEQIMRRFGLDAQVLDEGWNVTPVGFFDRKLLVQTDNGVVAEIQIWSPKLFDAKFSADNKFGMSGQDMYTEARGIDTPVARKEELENNMRELYQDALQSEDQAFRDLVGTSIEPKTLSNFDFRAFSEASTLPESATSIASTGVQAPPGSRMATASPLAAENRMAGRPSQSTKVGDVSINPPEVSIDDLTPAINLDDEIPLDLRVDADGEVVSQTTTLRQIKEEIDQDQAMLDRLEGCIR